RPGGRAATQQRQGFALNRGIHALYTGGAASRVLAELGVAYTAGSPKDTFALDGGRLCPLPIVPTWVLGASVLSVGDKLALLRLFARLARADAHALAATSAQDWLARAAPRPRVRRLLAAL